MELIKINLHKIEVSYILQKEREVLSPIDQTSVLNFHKQLHIDLPLFPQDFQTNFSIL